TTHTLTTHRAVPLLFSSEIPDIINSKQLKVFREWNGDLKKLPNIKMKKISSKEMDRTKEEERKDEEEEELVEDSDSDNEEDDS
ncbi:hypothetical protein UPYG_G00050460, partial [Umbra pygmaea]